MLRQVIDAVREQRDLRFSRTGVGGRFGEAIFCENSLFCFGSEFHRQIGVTRLELKYEKKGHPASRSGRKGKGFYGSLFVFASPN